jgi:homoserine O-acetyltransferase
MKYLGFSLIALAAATAFGAELRFAELRDLRLDSGATLPSCKVGYRTIGELNKARTNAVLFPTWFSGRSADLEGFAGPGKLVDSSEFFVVLVDALGNGVSCSESNVAPADVRFSVSDMVRSQYRLLTEVLGVKHLHAVMGISMGGMQTFEWITAYPEFMDRAIPIIGSPKLTPPDLLLWNAELWAIENAQKCGGDLRNAMRAVNAMHQFALWTPAYEARLSGDAFEKLQAQMRKDASEGMDPRDWASQLRAMIGHDVTRHAGGRLAGAARLVKAKTLVVVASQDHMVNPATAREFAKEAGAEVLELTGDCGHMATSCEADKLGAAVRAFLEPKPKYTRLLPRVTNSSYTGQNLPTGGATGTGGITE